MNIRFSYVFIGILLVVLFAFPLTNPLHHAILCAIFGPLALLSARSDKEDAVSRLELAQEKQAEVITELTQRVNSLQARIRG